MKRLGKPSFKKQLFMSFIIVACIPLLISGLGLFYIFKGWVTHNDKDKAWQQLEQVEGHLSDVLAQLEETADRLSVDPLILNYLREETLVKHRAYIAFYAETTAMRKMASFSLYDRQGNCQFTTDSNRQAETLPTYWGLLKRSQLRPDEMIFEKGSGLPAGIGDCLQGGKAIIDEADETLGFVVVTISEEGFQHLLQETEEGTSGMALLDGFWERIYSTQKGKKMSDTLRSLRLGKTSEAQSLKAVDYVMKQLGSQKLYVVLYKDSIFTEDFNYKMQWVIGLMTAGSLVWCFAAVGVVSGWVTRPIHHLVHAMQEVENGHLGFRVNSQRKDEIGQLARSFDHMTEELTNYMTLQIQQQHKLNESQTALMQAQLNPHFLYNTLDTIKWVAKANQLPELGTLALGLAKILRASITGAPFIRLSEELQLIEAYMAIQKVRFSGKFCLDVEIEPELESCKVPKLILQPIVENAIIHGFKESEYGYIFMNIMKQGDKMVITIEDDGKGIEDDILEALNSGDRERLKDHIGFYNVQTIIRFNYGESYGMKAERRPTGGTKVEMILPILREEAGHV